jgi:hypothetical protein
MFDFFGCDNGPVALIESPTEVLEPTKAVEFVRLRFWVRFFGLFFHFRVLFGRHQYY